MTTTSLKTAILLDVASVHPELNINNEKVREIDEQNQPQPFDDNFPVEEAPQSDAEALPDDQERQPADEALPIEPALQPEQDLAQNPDLNQNEGRILDFPELAPATSIFDVSQESSCPLKHPNHILMVAFPLIFVILAQFAGYSINSQPISDPFEYDFSSDPSDSSDSDDSEVSSESDFDSDQETRASTNDADNSSSAEAREGDDLGSFLTDHEDESDPVFGNGPETRASTEIDEASVTKGNSGQSTLPS